MSDFFADFLSGTLFSEQPEYRYSEGDMLMRKAHYESELDNMFGRLSKLESYAEMVDNIKQAGWKVMRNSLGQHKIVRK